MIIVDEALRAREREGNPVRVGVAGAGAMGAAIIRQIARVVPGMEVVAIANRTVAHAQAALESTGLAGSGVVVTDEPEAVCAMPEVDVVLEVTGTVERGARTVLAAIEAGKHVVTMNAELQGTLGPVLRRRADAAGVIFSDSDGDQPGVMMNLFRFVRSQGLRPVMIGNIKGLHDVRRTPETQAGFARTHGLSATLATSAADGTKMSFEQAIVANATGFSVAVRGMYGPGCDDVEHAAALFPLERMLAGGIVDYVVGARPAPGVFVLATEEDPEQQRWLKLYKLGDGPLYTFYTPCHLCHMEAPMSLARAVLFGDATIAPAGPLRVGVVTTAKRDLQAGETLDGIGGFATYGLAENADAIDAERLLPIGLAEGCRLVRDVRVDEVLTFDDVEVPGGRVVCKLWAEQSEMLRHAAGVAPS